MLLLSRHSKPLLKLVAVLGLGLLMPRCTHRSPADSRTPDHQPTGQCRNDDSDRE